jgi:hypothetical protein
MTVMTIADADAAAVTMTTAVGEAGSAIPAAMRKRRVVAGRSAESPVRVAGAATTMTTAVDPGADATTIVDRDKAAGSVIREGILKLPDAGGKIDDKLNGGERRRPRGDAVLRDESRVGDRSIETGRSFA